MSSHIPQRRHTGTGPAADTPQPGKRERERDVSLDAETDGDIRLADLDPDADLDADFVSEEALPPRRPRKSRFTRGAAASDDHAALDAFEHEPSTLAEPSIPDWAPPTDVAPAVPNPRRDRWIFSYSALPVLAACAALFLGVTVTGLLLKRTGDPPDPTRTATFTATPENLPAAPPPAAASPTVPTAAPIAEAGPAAAPPTGTPEAEIEPSARQAASPPAARTPAAAAAAAPAAARDTASAGPEPTADGQIAQVRSPAGRAPAVPPATLPTPSARLDDSERPILPGEPIATRRLDDSPSPAAAPEPAVPSAQDQVSAVLAQYQSAYARLDAESVQAIWPSLDRPRLERAFRNLEWQDLEFTECRLNIVSASATVTCRGVVEYATRVGNTSARDAREWTFTLKKESETWVIQNAQMR